ncbi:sulfatase-like hydrolase/transferase [Pseudalkalibacillus hwajinpoensis]|uniref:sulfatase-like hydrolase/transferase n=1 Tax=Guptibacillus hwajinpoensis TaxID=208199 RepID=UPI00325B7F0B
MGGNYSKSHKSPFANQCNKPNFLILIVDQERYPSVYENKELKEWRRENLVTQELLRENGFEFKRHYAGSSACLPSRTTLCTGHYPSLHGVTQTGGTAKTPFVQNTVPTVGDYLRKAGYRLYSGKKKHLSGEDIIIPCNSGSAAATEISDRNATYATEIVELLQSLEKGKTSDTTPWMIIGSFINPFNITSIGVPSEQSPLSNFEAHPSDPIIPIPTVGESLSMKTTAEESYRNTCPKALQSLIDTPFYQQVYYSLQKQADQELLKVLQALQKSAFYQDTIVIFLSEHGELFGAGGVYQKWYNTYEESIHVPMIIHSPALFSGRQSTEMLTSHVDVLPTILGLAGIDEEEVQGLLCFDHPEVRSLVGRDLTPLLSGRKRFYRANEPLYFMTDDDISSAVTTHKPYQAVTQPNSVEAVITKLQTGRDHQKEIWKYSRYCWNPQFWNNPGGEVVTVEQSDTVLSDAHEQNSLRVTSTQSPPLADHFELYNLTTDPLEEKNLANPAFETPESKEAQKLLNLVLNEQCRQKKLSPISRNARSNAAI